MKGWFGMKRRIGIVYAMRQEAGKFLPGTPPMNRHGGVEFWTKFGGDLVIAVGGVGKVNSAMATQAMIDVYDPGIIINAGICGCVEPGKVGNVYLARDLVQHDVDTSAIGDLPGFVSTIKVTYFEATALRRIKKLTSGTYKPEEYEEVRLATGDWFGEAGDRLNSIKLQYKPYLLDMEGAAVAQVCMRNDVEFLAIKSVSDTLADGFECEYEREKPLAIANLSYAVMDIVDRIRQEDKIR